MPLKPKRLDHNIRHRLSAPLALRTIAIGMTIDTPSIPILLHKRRSRVERITALGAEEVTRMPLRATRDNDLALDRRLAALASG